MKFIFGSLILVLCGCSAEHNFYKRQYLPGKYRQSKERAILPKEKTVASETASVTTINQTDVPSMSQEVVYLMMKSDTLSVQETVPLQKERTGIISESSDNPVKSEYIPPVSGYEHKSHSAATSTHSEPKAFKQPTNETPLATKITILFFALLFPSLMVRIVCGPGNESITIFYIRTAGALLLVGALVVTILLNSSTQIGIAAIAGTILLLGGIIAGIYFMIRHWQKE